MTDEQINAAVAKASGWSKEEGFYVWHSNGIDRTCWELWDWCNDLNAMHEAEKMLTREEMEDYVIEVMQFSHEPMIATARQRAEAFLRTMGKWEEAK